jgi:RNA polymerase subunit RPABC4/transcription elongation factor Spt4
MFSLKKENCKVCNGTGLVEKENALKEIRQVKKEIRQQKKPRRIILEEVKDFTYSLSDYDLYEQCPHCEKTYYVEEWKKFVNQKNLLLQSDFRREDILKKFIEGAL